MSTARQGISPVFFLGVLAVLALIVAVMFGPSSPLRAVGGPAELFYTAGIATAMLALLATIAYYLLTR